MPSDRRTEAEKDAGYPPGPDRMVRYCTIPICGDPSPTLFDLIDQEVVAYLNQPGVTADSLYSDFGDASGSFRQPSIHGRGEGLFLQFLFGRQRDMRTARLLAQSSSQDWLDILRINNVGPDTYYDLFQLSLQRFIHRSGQCLFSFAGSTGSTVNGAYFKITGPSTVDFVKVSESLPFNIADNSLFVAQEVGSHSIVFCHPSVEFADPSCVYQASELDVITNLLVDVEVHNYDRILRIGLGLNSITVFPGPHITKVGIHRQRPAYPHGNPAPINKRGNRCPNEPDDGCKQFAYTDQKDLELSTLRGAVVPNGASSVVLHGLNLVRSGRYKIVGYSDDDRICTTVRDLAGGIFSQLEVDLSHHYDLSRLNDPPPRKAFLRGDIVRQHQRKTRWCGPYSLAHAASYWFPERYGPTKDNGKWFGETIRDELLLVGDIVPGTLQSTLVSGARGLGFRGGAQTAFEGPGFGEGTIGPNIAAELEALVLLKQWTNAGIPVIVAVDEHMTDGVFHWGAEHYKLLVGYDDDAVLSYEDNNGTISSTQGALYFVNSGAFGHGELSGNLQEASGVPPHLRETHSDYASVPIGNDVDSYRVFIAKWRMGGVRGATDNYWYFPVYPQQQV
jgi:hypothetical protein